MFSCMISCVQSMEALVGSLYFTSLCSTPTSGNSPTDQLSSFNQLQQKSTIPEVFFRAKREAFHFTKTNKVDNSSLDTQIWFHYTSNNSLSAGAPVSQLYLVKLLCYAQKPSEDMHGDSDRINRRMSSSLHCFPCLVIIAHNNFHHIGATGFID